MKKMKAVGFYAPLPVESQDSLQDVTLPVPVVSGHDLLVRVAAVSVNPVDVGVRHAKRRPLSAPKIIGWDAYGTVTAVGDQTSLFKVGDKVYYAGSFKRPGSDKSIPARRRTYRWPGAQNHPTRRNCSHAADGPDCLRSTI